VGKSTLINALAGRKIAQTSATPGKTRLANFYRVQVHGSLRGAGAPTSWRFFLVDLPGYGYAKGGKDALEQFARVTGEYFQGRGEGSPGAADRLRAVLLIVDARHPGLDADLVARDWVLTLGVPHAVAATKIDKLSRGAALRAVRDIGREMNAPVLPVSAVTGEGLDDLWTHIVKLASN